MLTKMKDNFHLIDPDGFDNAEEENIFHITKSPFFLKMGSPKLNK